LKFTLQTPVSVSEDRWTDELLLPGQYAKHSVEGLLRGDSAARASFYNRMITDGWGSRNEARDLEDREPVDGLDEFIVPSNMTLISVDGQIVPLSSAGASAADATSA
jgi:phage portal protein BeeE